MDHVHSFSYPPLEYLFFVAKNCPSAVYTYLNLWKSQDSSHRLFITRNQIRDEESESWTCFVNNLRKLSKQDLLEWKFSKDGESVVIELAQYEYEKNLSNSVYQ